MPRYFVEGYVRGAKCVPHTIEMANSMEGEEVGSPQRRYTPKLV